MRQRIAKSFGRSFATCSLIAMAACMGAQNASAQNADASGNDGQAEKSRQANVGEIVVTAQRREQRLTEVPISVQAVTSETIDRAAISSATEVIGLTPSVSFKNGFAPNATSVAMRGITSVAQEGGVQPSTAIVVDDVAYYSQGEFVTDFADIERVEVLRGPQGTLFGKNATAGVINIVNKKPVDYFEGSVEGGYTTDNEFLIRGIANIPLGKSVALRINAFNKDRDFILENRSPITRGSVYEGGLAEKSWGVAGKLAFEFSPDVKLLLASDYSKYEGSPGAQVILAPSTDATLAAAQIAAGVIATRSDPFTYSDAPNFATTSRFGVSGTLDADLSDTLSVKSITAYREFDYDSSTNVDGGPWGGWSGVGLLPDNFGSSVYWIAEGGGNGLPRAPVTMNYFTQEVRFNYVSGPLNVIFGGYMQLHKAHGTNSVPLLLGAFGFALNNNRIDYRTTDNIYSGFADATFDISGTLSAFAGLRYTHEKLTSDYHKEAFFTTNYDPITFLPLAAGTITDFDISGSKNNLSGRAGLRYAPSRDHSYYASYSRGYKGPALDVSRAATAATAFLKPEIANAFEVGTKHVFGGNISTSLAIYYQTIDDVQQSAVIPGTANTRLQNTGKIESYGAEFDLSAKLTDAFKLDGGLAYSHASYQDFTNTCYPGQTATLGCNVASGTGIVQSLDGAQTQGAPEFAARISGTYEFNTGDSLPFDTFLTVSYAYESSIISGLTNDPLLREPGHSLLDATLGLTGKEDRWQLLIYGRNLTNEFYCSSKTEAGGVIGREICQLPRNYKRYGGAMLKVSF